MRNAIEYYYDIEVDDLSFEEGKYFFQKYILVPKVREFDLNLYKYISNLNVYNFRVVINKENNYVTSINGLDYILLERRNNYQLNISNLLNNLIPLGKQEIPWDRLWEEKLDYYEDYLKTISSTKLKESFVYYSGLTENAIKFYKEVKREHEVYLSHLRLTEMEYLNPINCIVDYKVRDIGEYIKYIFFADEIENINFDYLFNNLNEMDLFILYARLLYPSYYYDCYEKITNGTDDNILDMYISRIEEYEVFLKNIYFKMKMRINLPKIEWIIKKLIVR